MSEEGLTLRHPQEFFEVRVAGSTMPRRVFRTSEGLIAAFTLYNLTMDAYQRKSSTTTHVTTLTAGRTSRESALYRGRDVNVSACAAARSSVSGTSDGHTHAWAQYWIPQAYQSGSPEPVFTKSDVAGLAFELMALYDTTNGVGHFSYRDRS